MSTTEREPWDQQPGESAKAFAAFCLYLRLGSSRSIDLAYRSQLSPEANEARAKGRKTPGRWREWCKLNDWCERAKAWDVRQEILARRHAEAEHQAALREHLERQRELARANVELATAMLQKARERLATVQVEEIEVKHLPAFVRAAASVAEAGTEAEAHALAVDKVLGSLGSE